MALESLVRLSSFHPFRFVHWKGATEAPGDRKLPTKAVVGIVQEGPHLAMASVLDNPVSSWLCYSFLGNRYLDGMIGADRNRNTEVFDRCAQEADGSFCFHLEVVDKCREHLGIYIGRTTFTDI